MLPAGGSADKAAPEKLNTRAAQAAPNRDLLPKITAVL
jgi:hypothetical protein